MAKTAFTPIQPARRGQELLTAIGQQLNAVPSAMPFGSSQPDTDQQASEPPTHSAAARDPTPTRPAPFVLRLSPSVFRQIDARAVEHGVTMTVVIARALVDAGFTVPEDDLKDRRKRRYRG